MISSVAFYLFWILFTREGLGEAYDGDIAFASALETFGGGHNDPISVAFGGTCLTLLIIYQRWIDILSNLLWAISAILPSEFV